MRRLLSFFLFVFTCFVVACNNSDSNPAPDESKSVIAAEPPRIGFSVLNTYPHDTSIFTEGLEFHEGQLFEASGGDNVNTPHPSAFGIADLKTGKMIKKVDINNTRYFGEGITFFNGKIYELTYKSEKGFIYDARTFKKIREFYYPGEGWSLTHDSTHLIMSTGSSNLLIIDPNQIGDTLKVQRILGVSDNNGPVANINELEYIHGYIYANQWQTNYILKIDPSNGMVVGKLDLSNLEAEARKKYENLDVLNGIAYNPTSNTLFVTGKLWPTIYEIQLN